MFLVESEVVGCHDNLGSGWGGVEDELARGYLWLYIYVYGNKWGIGFLRKSGSDGKKILVLSGNYR